MGAPPGKQSSTAHQPPVPTATPSTVACRSETTRAASLSSRPGPARGSCGSPASRPWTRPPRTSSAECGQACCRSCSPTSGPSSSRALGQTRSVEQRAVLKAADRLDRAVHDRGCSFARGPIAVATRTAQAIIQTAASSKAVDLYWSAVGAPQIPGMQRELRNSCNVDYNQHVTSDRWRVGCAGSCWSSGYRPDRPAIGWPRNSGSASSPWPSSKRKSTVLNGCAAGGATSKPATTSPCQRPATPSSTSSAASNSSTPSPSRSTGPSTSPSGSRPTMRDWLTGLMIALGLMVAGWVLLLLLARRLPPGPLRELARFIPDCVTTVRRLRRDPRVPRRAKIAIVLAGLWLASPIDLIPEFLPVIGPLDDVVVVALALRYAGRQVPRQVLLEAWPGETRLLERLLGPARG